MDLDLEPRVYVTPFGEAEPLSWAEMQRFHQGHATSTARMWATLWDMDLTDEIDGGKRGTRAAEYERQKQESRSKRLSG